MLKASSYLHPNSIHSWRNIQNLQPCLELTLMAPVPSTGCGMMHMIKLQCLEAPFDLTRYLPLLRTCATAKLQDCAWFQPRAQQCFSRPPRPAARVNHLWQIGGCGTQAAAH